MHTLSYWSSNIHAKLAHLDFIYKKNYWAISIFHIKLDISFAVKFKNTSQGHGWQFANSWYLHTYSMKLIHCSAPQRDVLNDNVPAQFDSLARFDPRQVGHGLIWCGSKRANESQYGLDHKTIEQNEFYDLMSLSYILLCNSLALSGIQSVFGMDAPWHNRHQPTNLLLW